MMRTLELEIRGRTLKEPICLFALRQIEELGLIDLVRDLIDFMSLLLIYPDLVCQDLTAEGQCIGSYIKISHDLP